MAFIATPQGVKVSVEAQQNGVPVVNVYHVDVNAAVTPSDLEDIANIFADWMLDDVLPSLHTSYEVTAITATDISVEDGAQFQLFTPTGYEGGAAGEPAAANAALVISWRTAQTGRSYRGRTYVGGLPNSQLVTAQNVAGTYAAAFATYADNLMDLLTAAGYTLSVLSKVLNGVARVAGVLTEIISIVVDTKVDSQRRRTAN